MLPWISQSYKSDSILYLLYFSQCFSPSTTYQKLNIKPKIKVRIALDKSTETHERKQFVTRLILQNSLVEVTNVRHWLYRSVDSPGVVKQISITGYNACYNYNFQKLVSSGFLIRSVHRPNWKKTLSPNMFSVILFNTSIDFTNLHW